MPDQIFNIRSEAKISDEVEKYDFEPIKGYPMLRWKGKRPFESTIFFPAQLKETYGEPDDFDGKQWINKIFWGDNLQVMSHLLKTFRGQVDLIYIDPPFDSKADYKMTISLRGKKAQSETSSFEEKQYTDIWSNDEYLQFMYERLILMRELLSESGTIYLHCDHRQSYLLRCILNEIFGQDNFQNVITWRRQVVRGMKVYASYYSFSSDYILIYSKNKQKATWNRQVRFNKISQKEAEQKYMKDERGFFRTSDPGSYSFESLLNLYNQGRLYAPKNGSIIIDQEKKTIKTSNGGVPAVKYYRDIDKDGLVIEEITIDNIWDDVPGMGVVSSEFIGYPTQKPMALLERVIKASSNPGDLVFDCFMGSGTTQAVAMKLGRRFIGADINLGAIETTTKRLIKLQSELASKDESIPYYTGFELYNVNNYDVFRNPVQAHDLLIEALEITPLGKNSVFDGIKDDRMVKIMPVNRLATKHDLNELITGFDYRQFDERREKNPLSPVEHITLVCMGHDNDLAATLKEEMKKKGYNLDVEVFDILHDRGQLQFKRDSEASIIRQDGKLIIKEFYPMNLLAKLSFEKQSIDDWRILVDSIKIDWNFDSVNFSPTELDIPEDNNLVTGKYDIPASAGTIRIKITDIISESLEITLEN